MKHKTLLFASLFFLMATASLFGQSKSLYFDGINDYVTLGSNKTQAGMNGATGITLETWVNLSGKKSYNGIVDFLLNGSTSMVMMRIDTNGKIDFGGRSRSSDSFQRILTTQNHIVSTGTWYHIAGVLDFTGKTVKIYVNGELIDSRTSVAFGSNTYVSAGGAQEFIGKELSNSYFHGYMDELRIWKAPRTQEEILANMTETIEAQSNLLGYWKFDNNAYDSSGSGYNGTLTNGAAYSDTYFHFGDYYRTIGTGSWNNVSLWEVSADNSNWSAASAYPIAGVSAYIRTGNDITLNADATCENMILAGGSLTIGTYNMHIAGTLTQTSGSISGSPFIDGYLSDPNHLEITENGTVISGFSASTAGTATMPVNVNRSWTINGTFTGSKSVTFYWDAADDNNFPWGTIIPAVYQGQTEYTPTSYDVTSNPRYATVTLSDFTAKGTYTVGGSNNETLPVELSSFTAVLTADFFVELHWVTQSETEVSCFYVYRGSSASLDDATLISPQIEATNTSSPHGYEYADSELFEPGTYYYWLQVQEMDGGVSYHGPTTVYFDYSGNSGTPQIPVKNGFTSVFPNPFHPRTTISYGITKAGDVSFTIYNQKGQLVKSYKETQKNIGYWRLAWDGTDLNGRSCPTGIYFIKMHFGNQDFLTKAVLLK